MLAIANTAQKEKWDQKFGTGVACVISNRPGAEGLSGAEALGLATKVIDHKKFESRETFDAALQNEIDRHQPALVVLAGFMRIFTPAFVQHYAGRMINVHPSLLPAFPGRGTHQRAIDAGCRFAGATVHQVTVELDHGPILAQAVVPVLPGDSAETLAARVQTLEHVIYPQAIRSFIERGA